MKLQIRENSIFYSDSFGRTFRYELESVSTKIKNMICKQFNESNWGRLLQHKDSGCMMISACRGENTEEQNKKNTDSLGKDIKNNGLGYIRILGGYTENKGTDNEVDVTEESFFVPKPKDMDPEEFFNIAISLCKKYNQDSVLISLPDYVDFGYYDKSGKFDFSPGKEFVVSDKDIGQYFSQLVKGSKAGKKFAFKESTLNWLAVRHPNSHYQAVLMSKNNEYF